MPPFQSVTGQSRTTPHHAKDQKTVKVEVRQQHCPVRKIWKTAADPVRYQQKSTNLVRSHRLSSRGAYLRETPSRGRFADRSDGGRLFLNLFSNDRVGRAAPRLGVRAAFWNLRYGERYDVTHHAEIENPEKPLCWMTLQLQALSKMRNVHKMTFDSCASGSK